ncbi:MAG: DegV family protein [Sphaerochaetaceae bacterium]
MLITGTKLFDSVSCGYYHLLSNQQEINDINVFPVADGDTGTNMLHTFKAALTKTNRSKSIARTTDKMAQSALIGARGNSGMIIAQFFRGFYEVAKDFEALSVQNFVASVNSAVTFAYDAVETPVEGTILTVMHSWSRAINEAWHAKTPIPLLLRRALRSAKTAETLTTEQLQALKKAGVVDAGARAFVYFLEGIDQYLSHGKDVRMEENQSFEIEHQLSDAHEQLLERPTFRYCTEALLCSCTIAPEKAKEVLHDLGDSLVIGSHKETMRVHIHTGSPNMVFRRLEEFSRIEETKVDDMLAQYTAIHERLSDIAIVTDSSADIPQYLKDTLQIYQIPQVIQWNDRSFIDRISVDNTYLLETMLTSEDLPTSSMPSSGSIGRHLEFLSEHYREIIIISVSAALSGTFRTYELAARELRKRDYPIQIIDCKRNAGAQGLITIKAAQAAADGESAPAIKDRIASLIKRSTILVSVQSLESMVRGGRVPEKIGRLIVKSGIKPIVGLSPEGSGAIKGIKLTQNGSASALIRRFVRDWKHGGITEFSISHVKAPELAHTIALIIQQKTGLQPKFIQETSPVVSLHAGKGAVSIAWIREPERA